MPDGEGRETRPRYDPRTFRRAPSRPGPSDPVASVRQSHGPPSPSRQAALATFLLFYRQYRPEVLRDCQSRLLPLWSEVEDSGGRFLEAYWQWLKTYGLPDSAQMAHETAQTLDGWLKQEAGCGPSDALSWFSEGVWDLLGSKKPSPQFLTVFGEPFRFEAPGWSVLFESEREARERIQREFRAALTDDLAQKRGYLDEHEGIEAYRGRLTRGKRLRRSLRLLARWQANPSLPQSALLSEDDSAWPRSPQTVRAALRRASKAIGLAPDRLRRPQRGPDGLP